VKGAVKGRIAVFCIIDRKVANSAAVNICGCDWFVVTSFER